MEVKSNDSGLYISEDNVEDFEIGMLVEVFDIDNELIIESLCEEDIYVDEDYHEDYDEGYNTKSETINMINKTTNLLDSDDSIDKLLKLIDIRKDLHGFDKLGVLRGEAGAEIEKLEAKYRLGKLSQYPDRKSNGLLNNNGIVKKTELDNSIKNNSDILLKELTTDKAKELFNRAINAGLVVESGNGYEWRGLKSELAYFAELASEHLNLQHGEKRNSFKPFETIFGFKGLSGAANDYKKLGKVPCKHKEIEKIFQ